MPKRIHASNTHCLGVQMSRDLYNRAIARAAVETKDRERHVSVGEVIRQALSEYLDTWEGATFVPRSALAKPETGRAV